MDAYRRLPYGWRTTPPDFPWTDLYMWRQFLAEPWCRARSAMVPTGINTWTHKRPHLNDRERAEDIANLRAKAAVPTFREDLWRAVARRFACESVSFEIEARRFVAMLDTKMSAMERSQASLTASMAEHRIEIVRLEAQCAELTVELDSMRASTSWRLTYPVRQIRRFMKKLRR